MVQTSPTPFDVGRAFVHQYYTLLHQAPHMLHRFYSTDSTFIHGGVDRPGCVEQPAVGPENISQRINDLNLRDCHAKIRQVDSHPTIGDGVVVQVTGELSNNGDPMRRFMQTFVLAPRQPKKYYVQNDIFRYQDEVFDDGSDDVDEDDQSGSNIYGDTISNTDKVSNAGSSAPVPVPSQQQQQQPLLVTGTERPAVEEQQQPLPPRNVAATLGNNQQPSLPSQVGRQQDQQHSGSNNLNGFSSGTESTGYGSLGQQTHLQTQQQESVQSKTQPSPRPVNSQVNQENAQQTNGGNVPNQQQQLQQVKQTAPTTEGQRPEGTSYARIAKMNPSVGSTPNVNTNSNVNSTSTSAPRGAPTAPGTTTSASQQSNAVRPSVNKAPVTTANRPNSNSQSGQQRPGNNYYPQNNRSSTVSTVPNEQQVFVGSLPLEFTRETLIEFFSKYGNVLDAKTYTPTHDTKKNFGFVAFDNSEVAANLIQSGHVMYNDSIRLNIEPKSSRNSSANNNSGGNFNNGPQGGGRNSNYSNRGGNTRGGNRAPYRGSGSNQRRGGYNNNSSAFVGSDENNNDYRSNKVQIPIQQQ